MKKYILIIIVLSFVACGSEKLEFPPAQQKVEALIKDIDNGKYKEVSNYYTDQFNKSESVDARAAKYKQLKDLYGNITQILLLDTLKNANKDEEASLLFTYRIKHDRLTTIEVFTVVKEDGDYKISSQSIKSTEN